MQAGAKAEAVDLSLKASRTVAWATWNTLFGLPHRLGPPLRCAVPRLSAVLYGLVSKSHFQYTLTAFGRFCFRFRFERCTSSCDLGLCNWFRKAIEMQTDRRTDKQRGRRTDGHALYTHTDTHLQSTLPYLCVNTLAYLYESLVYLENKHDARTTIQRRDEGRSQEAQPTIQDKL